MKYRISILGGNGQLGKSIFGQLKNINNIYVKLYSKKKIDITKKNFTLNPTPDLIINCAAYTDVDLSEKYKTRCNKVNNLSLANLSKYCNKNNSMLIHFSTDFVFHGFKKNYYYEDARCIPINYYGKSKLKGEKLLMKNCKNYLIFRISWLYSKFNNNFLKSIIKNLIKNQKTKVVSNLYGTPTSCLFISNFFKENLIRMINYNDKQRIFHLTDGKKISKYHFAKLIAKHLNLDNLIVKNEYRHISLAKRPKNTSLKSKFLKKKFIFQNIDWRKNLKDTINSL